MGKASDSEIISTLMTNGGNKSDCARKLGIDRKTIQNRFKDAEFIKAFDDAVESRDGLIRDLRTTATVKALEYLIDVMNKPTTDILEPWIDAVTRQEKLDVAKTILRMG